MLFMRTGVSAKNEPILTTPDRQVLPIRYFFPSNNARTTPAAMKKGRFDWIEAPSDQQL